MSDSVALIYKEGSIVFSHGSIIGDIWFDIDAVPFPEKGWNDLILALVSGWLVTLSEFSNTDTRHCSLSFMEGPFKIELIKIDAHWELQTIHNDQKNGLPIVLQKPRLFYMSVLSTARKVMSDVKKLDVSIIKTTKSISLDIQTINRILRQEHARHPGHG
jgi:hypothetical protein